MKHLVHLYPALFFLASLISNTLDAAVVPIVNHGDVWYFRKGTNAITPTDWKTTSESALAADGTWLTGAGGFGYGTSLSETSNCGTSIMDASNKWRTVYIRKTFTITSPLANNLHLFLRADYDDGYIAWLDGVYLTNRNVGSTEPLWSAGATASHECSTGQSTSNRPETNDLGMASTLLPVGTHTLAIIGQNQTLASTDFVLVADLFTDVGPDITPITNGISGNIAVDTTWYTTNSFYTVTGNVVVPSNVTLTIQPGVTVRFRTGTSLTVNGRLLADGTETQPITFTRHPGDTTWERLWFVDAAASQLSHCIIEYANCVGDHKDYYATNCSFPTNETRAYHEAVVVLASHVDFDYCSFTNLPDAGATAEGDALAIISDDYYHPGRASANVRNCNFVRIGQGVHTRLAYVLVENCYFKDKHGDNDDVDLVGESTPPCVIRNNLFMWPSYDDRIHPTKCSALIYGNVIYGSTDHGIVLRDFCRPVVYNNVLYNCSAGGITVQNGCEALIMNNTLVNCNRAIKMFDHLDRIVPPYCLTAASGNATVVNNIIWNSTPAFDLSGTSFGSLTANVSYSDVQGGTANLLTKAGSVFNIGPGNFDANPLFADAANTNFHILAGSPCIDAGTNRTDAGTDLSAYLTFDLDGAPRPLDGNGDSTPIIDIGAYEVVPFDAVLACPAGVVVNCAPGQCQATVTYSATTTAFHPGVTVSCDPPSGSVFPKGTVTVACTAWDQTEHTNTCSFPLTVVDAEAPALTCPANTLIVVQDGQTTTNVAYTVGVTDNCPGAAVVCVPPSGSAFPIGTSAVNCQATDASGNTSACSFTVSVTERTLRPGLTEIGPLHRLKLLIPASYIPGIPFMARLEVLQPDDHRAWDVWDADATISTPTPGIVLSTNRIHLYNGLGSILVLVTNSGDFEFVAAAGPLQTNRTLVCKTNVPVTTVSGLLTGTTTWSGIIKVTSDLTNNGTLIIEPDTWVLINGVASSVNNPNGIDIEVRGTVSAMGTEEQPITFTASTNGYNWGEIRHVGSSRSLFRNTFINKGGRAPAGGHTGTGPMIRMGGNSTNIYDNCSLTDTTYGNDTMGKTMESSGSCDLTFTNCLLQRSLMGPEISGTGLRCHGTYFLEFLGSPIAPDRTNDNDAIYVHDQGGRSVSFRDCVVARTQDDGIDTLSSTIDIDNCIIRNCDNMAEDSKGISIFGGDVRIRNSLIVDNKCGISGKDYTLVSYKIEHCTIVALVEYAVGAQNKYGDQFPVVDILVTNSIVRTLNPLTNAFFTSYTPTDIHVNYSDISEAWPGAVNCMTADPLFTDVSSKNFHLQPASPCIDAGDPASPLDADGSRTDMGYPFPFTFSDTVKPVITCPADIVTSLAMGQTETNVSFVVEATDNYPGVSIACVPPSGSSFQMGTNTVNCVAVDSSSNRTTCSFLVVANQAANRPVLKIGSMAADGLHFNVTGDLGLKFSIEVSTNLIPPWIPLATVTNFSGNVQYIDPGATNSPYRFYRVIVSP